MTSHKQAIRIWTDKNGDFHPLMDMGERHIRNCLKMLWAQEEKWAASINFHDGFGQDGPVYIPDAYYECTDWILYFEEELKRRRLAE